MRPMGAIAQNCTCFSNQTVSAVLQAKLLEAVASQREAARQLQDAHQAFDGERAQLEQQVRRSAAEGSARIQTLEETIRKLGNRSDLHQVLVASLWPLQSTPQGMLAEGTDT